MKSLIFLFVFSICHNLFCRHRNLHDLPCDLTSPVLLFFMFYVQFGWNHLKVGEILLHITSRTIVAEWEDLRWMYTVCVCAHTVMYVCAVYLLRILDKRCFFLTVTLSWNSKPVFEDSSNIFELVGFCKASNNSDIYCIFTAVRLWASCFTCMILFNPVGLNIISI